MTMQEEHGFDRRKDDANVSSLVDRVTGIEGRVEVLEKNTSDNTRELRANTELTKQVHEGMFGAQEEPGMRDKVQEVYEILETAKSGFRFLSRWVDRLGKSSDWISRMLKRFWWLIALAVAVGTYVKTGKWEWPVFPG